MVSEMTAGEMASQVLLAKLQGNKSENRQKVEKQNSKKRQSS